MRVNVLLPKAHLMEIREPGLILASRNRVDLDIEGVKIIKSFPGSDLKDVNVEDLIQIKRARELGLSG